MPNEEVWTIEELAALTKEVQNGKVEYRGKVFTFQYCELTEAEEPKVPMVNDDASAEEKNDYYTKVGTERILAMVKKANDKNPDNTTLTEELWYTLPSTLRFAISSDILALDASSVSSNFISG